MVKGPYVLVEGHRSGAWYLPITTCTTAVKTAYRRWPKLSDLEQYDDNKTVFLQAMEDLRPDLFFPEAWNDEQRATAAELVRPQRMRTSLFASIPMKCEAEKCVFADICPLMKQGLAPKGKPCPIEMAAVQQFMSEYMEELGVDPNNLIEVSMIRDLVDQEIQYMRKTWILSKEHFIQENVVGVSDGEVVLQKQLHLAVELEDRLHKRKKDLRNQLLATREARSKAGQGQLDSSQTISKIMDEVRQIDRAKQKALEARLGYSDRDEYIDAEVVSPEED